MAQFPRTKPEMDALAQAILSGIAANPTDFPPALFSTTVLSASTTATESSVADRQQKEAIFRLSIETENSNYDTRNAEAQRLLTLAEAQHKAHPEKLGLIGWSAPAPAQARVPGAPRTLEAKKEGTGTVFLDWKAPRSMDGGRVAYYRIERRVKNTEEFGAWQATVIPSEAHLANQPHGVETEYRIIAVNPTGESLPSNTVSIVL